MRRLGNHRGFHAPSGCVPSATAGCLQAYRSFETVLPASRGGPTMLRSISPEFCLRRAEEHERIAAAAREPSLRDEWLWAAEGWREAAQANADAIGLVRNRFCAAGAPHSCASPI
jgi:hypothetical protein